MAESWAHCPRRTWPADPALRLPRREHIYSST